MTTSRTSLNNFMLTPQQQNLLFAALNSGRLTNSQTKNGLALSPTLFSQSPTTSPGDPNAFQESPFLDYDYSFDQSFDDSLMDQSGNGVKMIGDLPRVTGQSKSRSVSSNEGTDSPEKRTHPDDDDDEGANGAKRRESGEKVPKKPGRKPLTSEPTSKRKAQNRAAQRAFRERKEKHVKDLEIKVEELERASKAANHENGNLKAQVERLNVELEEYKKRVTLLSNSRSPGSGSRHIYGTPILNNINDVNFQFEFPTFGALPGPPPRNSSASAASRSSSTSKAVSHSNSPGTHASPTDKNTPDSSYSIGLDAQTREDLAKFSGIFNPPLTNNNLAKASGDSQAGAASSSSPSASSSSNLGHSSSCGTSPEPFTQSPMGFKPVDTLATIDENPALNGAGQDPNHFSAMTMPQIDWLANSANNFQFDPHLFTQYRDTQESVFGSLVPGDNFFNDAWDMDFTTPFNVAPSPVAPKTDLIAQIDAAKDSDEGSGELLTCNKIWEQLQGCQKVQSGDFDLDGLCSELQKKAKCSGHGAVVDERDFKTVVQKYLGKTASEMEACTKGKADSNAKVAVTGQNATTSTQAPA